MEDHVIEVDWITAKMYGVELKKMENDLPLSKNGIELLDELGEELDSALYDIDHKIFTPKKEKFWDNL